MATNKNMPLTNEQSAKETPLGVDESRRNTFSNQTKTLHELESIVIEGSSSQSTEKYCKIEKVPEVLRQNEANENCFTPLFIVLGPHHHQYGKENRGRGEELKTQLLREFYKGDKRSSLGTDHKKVKEVTSEARKCYSEDLTENFKNDEEFANMMFHDGCCVLQFISATVNGYWGQVNIKHHEQELFIHDLFLLENQLPFVVLKQLMPEGDIKTNFARFIMKIRSIPQVKASWEAKMADFFYNFHRKREQKKPNEDKEPLHLLHSLWTYYVGLREYDVAMLPLSKFTTSSTTNDWYSFRSTQELKAAGIMFSLAKTSRFTDVMYMPLHFLHISFLCLPPILVDDSTKSLLLNLAAYEMSSSSPNIYPVSSYICFMDSLMDQQGDVAELRRSGIILNRLRSDTQVVNLFKDAAKNLVSDENAFRHAKMHIEKHYRSKIKIKITKWLFFNISIMSLIPAIFGLGMTLIQTFVSVHEYARHGKK